MTLIAILSIVSALADDALPLAGIRVIDFGHYLAGPLAGMLLADQGAEVVKVNRPGYDPCDDIRDSVLNRGKKTIELDIKSKRGRETALELVDSADVAIENFRPGVMKRLGLSAEITTTRNPALIYLSLPGFSSQDVNAHVRAFEGILSAATGLFTDLNSSRRKLKAPPLYTPIPLASAYGAIHGALAVTLALYDRETTGWGEVIEVPLVGAAMSAMGAFLLRVENLPNRYHQRPNPANRHLRELMQEADEQEQQKLLEEVKNLIPPMFDSYQVSDGTWVFILAGNNRRHASQLTKALGIYEELLSAGMVSQPPYSDLSRLDNLQDADHLSPSWRQFLRQKIAESFLKKSADDWTAVMREYGVPFSVHRTTQEWLQRQETDIARLTVEIKDPIHGLIRQLGVQTSLSRTGTQSFIPKAASPGDLSALLKRRRKKPQPESTRTPHKILKGIRVLDLSTVIAGPCCARTLAEYGAEVIKIDSTEPYFGPSTQCLGHVEVSQGKRSMLVDLKSEQGRTIFQTLAAKADVVVHNFRPGVTERLQIDYARIASINRDIVYLNLTAFRGPRTGPWEDLPGFDPVLQAASGIASRYGGKNNRPEIHGFASCIDYVTGYSGSFGIALALLQRKRLGGGDLVLTSLAQGAQLVQLPFMWSQKERKPNDGPQGQKTQGVHSLKRIYRASDAWFFLAGTLDDLPRLQQIAEFYSVPMKPNEEQKRFTFLINKVSTRPVAFWEQKFTAAGFGFHQVDSIEDIRLQSLNEMRAEQIPSWRNKASISVIRIGNHPVGSPADTPAPTYARFENTSLVLGFPTPKQGQDTRAILRELDYSHEQINSLARTGIVKEQLHKDYLPY